MKRFLAFVLALVVFAGCSRKDEKKPVVDSYVCEPVRLASAYVALVEKPDAKRAFLLGEEAKALASFLERAGVEVSAGMEGEFDLILVACGDMSAESCAKVAAHLSEDGVLAWLMDVRGVTAARFRSMVKAFDLPCVHLWMPGESRWVLVGGKGARTVRMADMLDIFAREEAFADLAKARCGTLPEVFANYVGSREDVVPAFAYLDLSAEVRPENFLTKDVHAVDWLSRDGLDADIADGVLAEIRSLQIVRRLVAEGTMLAAAATDKEGEGKATDAWARAALRNPNDLFLVERLDRLDRNARGFLAVGKLLQAMKCFETMVLIRPKDAAAVHNFGMCLKRLGKADLAAEVLERAKTLSAAAGAGEP